MQARFVKNTFVGSKITGTHEWLVHEPFNFWVDDTLHTVPAGFRTNFASTPRALWAVFPPSGIYTEAAVAHDYLYGEQVFDQAKSDKIYKRLCEFCGVGKTRSSLMKLGLKLGGWVAYNKSKKAKEMRNGQ